jgi:protein-S-isoprenylcysteine O-methyltransferase Ste14
LVTWYASAFGTKRNLRHESLGSRLSHILPLMVGIWLIANQMQLLGALERRFIPGTETTYWSFAALTAAGLLFTVWARVHLGRNWSGTITVKEEHALITSGPYAVVRHPIYTGLLTALLASALAVGNWRAMIGFVIAFAALWRKLRLEESWMQETFGDSYVAYKARVRALIPYIL